MYCALTHLCECTHPLQYMCTQTHVSTHTCTDIELRIFYGWHFCMCNSGAAQRVFLSSNNLTPCYNSTVDLICHYPDVMERVNGQRRYTPNTPSWRVNGEDLFPDDDVFVQRPINQTSSRLRVRIDPAIFTGNPVSFTCYLPLTSGGEDSVSTVVDPQGTSYSYTHCTGTSINVMKP